MSYPRCTWTLVGGFAFSPLGLGRQARLVDTFRLDLAVNRGVAIPAGRTWDGPSFGRLTAASATWSLVHDHLYRFGDRALWSRAAADALAMAIARDHGTGWGTKDWHWRLAAPVLALAWARRWGGWGDILP